ncbi:MAG: MATE family efflux transporter [Gammaproteobacteria bacterium]|nr:MATE family efflux transporter [Gammaproteobacteria bacterium]
MKLAHQKEHRNVWRIAAPLIVSNITVPLLGMVDTAVMGHLPDARFLGAVAIGATIFSFLFIGFNFLRMGTTGVTAQAHGAGDDDGIRAGLGQAALLAVSIGALLILFQYPLRVAAMWLLSPDAEVLPEASIYFSIRIWGAPFTLLNFALIGWFIGMQSGRGPLYLMLAINLSNILLDLLFVVGIGMTADGVALASVIAEACGSGLGLWLAARKLRSHPGRWLRQHLSDQVALKRLVHVNSNLLVRTLSLMFAFGFLIAQSSRQGQIILAANAVMMQFQYLMAYALDGFANAAEALAGKAIGARDNKAFRKAVRVSLIWSLIVAVIFSLGFLVFGRGIVNLLTTLTDVREATYLYLPWIIVSPLLSVWSFLYDGVFVGGTRAREMRNTMLFSVFLIYLPAFYLLQPLGNNGLWLAFMLFMSARGISMHYLYKRIRWC